MFGEKAFYRIVKIPPIVSLATAPSIKSKIASIVLINFDNVVLG